MFCSACGIEQPPQAQVCANCGTPLFDQPYMVPPRRGLADDPAMRMVLPIGVSPLAIAAGYAGLFSMIPCFAPFAILLGVLAIRDIKAHPEKHGMGRAVFGLVMGIVFTIPLIAVLIAAVLNS